MAILSPNSPVTSVIELDLTGLTPAQKDRAKRAAGEIIIDGINDILDESRSPVSGGAFEKQKADGERSILFEFGDMRDSLEWRDAGGNSIEVGSWDPDETPKLFNHTTGDTLPQRQVLPSIGEEFKQEIMSRVNSAIQDIRETGAPRRRTLGDAFTEIVFDIPTGTKTRTTTIGSIIDLGDE